MNHEQRSFFGRVLAALCAPLAVLGVVKTPAATGLPRLGEPDPQPPRNCRLKCNRCRLWSTCPEVPR